MLDWKIMGASFVALIAVSSMFVSGFGANDLFSGLFEKIGGWLKESPFGGIFSSPPVASTKSISIVLYPTHLEIEPDDPINITLGEVGVSHFSGIVSMNFLNKIVELGDKNTDLAITMPLENATLTGLRFGSLALSGLNFDIEDMKAENGTIEVLNFVGSGILQTDRLTLTGNVSRVNAQIGEMVWELK